MKPKIDGPLGPVELELTEIASTIGLPGGVVRKELTFDTDYMRNVVLGLLRASVLTSKSEVVEKSFDFVEHYKPRWMPKFIWNRIPKNTHRCTLSTRYSATHPYADIPELRDGLGRVVLQHASELSRVVIDGE